MDNNTTSELIQLAEIQRRIFMYESDLKFQPVEFIKLDFCDDLNSTVKVNNIIYKYSK